MELNHVGWISIGFSGIIGISLIITLYRYLGNDFLIDLFKIINPFMEDPKLEKEYTVGDDRIAEKIQEASEELGYEDPEEFVDDAIDTMSNQE